MAPFPASPSPTHTLIVGGTGMLFEASRNLAHRSLLTTSVARTWRSLHRLDAALSLPEGRHLPLCLDWSDAAAFLDGVERHVAASGPPDLVVAWVHGEELALQLASRLATVAQSLRFVHVIGSSSANPLAVADALRRRFVPPPHLRYDQVVLGAKDVGRRSRWLTHEAISNGVLEAVRGNERYTLVGTLERWRGRP